MSYIQVLYLQAHGKEVVCQLYAILLFKAFVWKSEYSTVASWHISFFNVAETRCVSVLRGNGGRVPAQLCQVEWMRSSTSPLFRLNEERELVSKTLWCLESKNQSILKFEYFGVLFITINMRWELG